MLGGVPPSEHLLKNTQIVPALQTFSYTRCIRKGVALKIEITDNHLSRSFNFYKAVDLE